MLAGARARATGTPRARAAAALAAAALAGAAPAAAQGEPRGHHDPAASGRTLATAVVVGGEPRVVVRAPGRPAVTYPGARQPALDRGLLAYADDRGIRVVRWQNGEEAARIAGRVAKPAIQWPRVAFVRDRGGARTLEVMDVRSRRARVVARAGRHADLGRPALRQNWIAWHVAAGRRSELRVRRVGAAGTGRLVARSATAIHVNPSVQGGHIAWVESRGEASFLRLRRLGGGPVRTLARLGGPDRILWTTAMAPRAVYVTRWLLAPGRASIVRRAWTPIR